MFPRAWVHTEFSYDGWAQWVIYVEKRVLVSAIFVGREAGGLLHASTVVIVSQVPVSRLWHAVAGFPILREIYIFGLLPVHFAASYILFAIN